MSICDFGRLQIAYDEGLLTPRPWTHCQSLWARELLTKLLGPVLELCCGAGHIGLAAVSGTGRRLVAVDVDPRAILYARRNAEEAGVDVDLRLGRAAEALRPDEQFGLIIADPPWVPAAETAQFPEDPLLAIDGGEGGLSIVGECVQTIGAHLAPGGVALLQLAPGDEQADAVASMDPRLKAGERRYFPRGTLLRLDAM